MTSAYPFFQNFKSRDRQKKHLDNIDCKTEMFPYKPEFYVTGIQSQLTLETVVKMT